MKPARGEFGDGRRYAVATLSEMAAPLLRGAARAIVAAPAAPPAAWRRGLIVGHAHIGDVLYRTGSLDALTAGLPECEWFYLCTPFAAEILHGNPAITRVLPWMTTGEPESALRRHRAELRDLAFDVALCTEYVRVHAGLMTAVAIGIPNRVAFTEKGWSGLATHGVRLSGATPRPVQIRRMVADITGVALMGEPRPRVYPDTDDLAAAAAEWDRIDAGAASRLIACSVTTRQSIATYPSELFAGILRGILARDPSARIVLLGSGSDAQLLDELARAVGRQAVVSAGRLGLRAVVAFLARCDAFVGSDSGPRHLANAAGIPVFFVRNLAACEIHTGAYLSTEHDLAPHGQFLDHAETLRVLGTVDVETAAAQILTVIARERDTRGDMPR